MRPPARLSQATLGRATAGVSRPAYDRSALSAGILHFGPGAFHRAHQASFVDQMLARDPGLAITAVSLHSRDVAEALNPQDGLYALAARGTETRWHIVGAIREVLVAPDAPQAVLARLTSPQLRAITATVTEKGYCLTAQGDLDLDHPDIGADLAGGRAPRSFPGWLFAGLQARRAAGLAAPVVLSCDNLPGNGRRLRRALAQFGEAAGEVEMAGWIDAEVRFADTMVDSITPATDAALRAEAAAALGLTDAWPVQREDFVQWVVEEGPLGPLAGVFESAGVTLAGDVAAFETAKLRLLNGAHSTLAYLGLLVGYATVAEAMADPALASFMETLMRQDIGPTLGRSGVPAGAYIDQVLTRFRNPAIAHQLAQIAWDGSQKLPVRLLPTIEDALGVGRPVGRLAVGVAAWMAFVARQARRGVPITDPLATRLAGLGRRTTGDPDADVDLFLGLREVFPAGLAAREAFRRALIAAYRGLGGPDPRQALAL